jgi:predicted nuclease of predicted toxin-antitoxin system
LKIIIDECLPKRLTKFFSEHEVWTVPQIGLGGSSDTILLDELDKREIDLFITIDGNIEYQQQFKGRVFGTIVIRSVSNRFSDLVHLETTLVEALQGVTAGEIIHLP